MTPSMAELTAPVTVAEIELTDPTTVTHVSIAGPSESGRISQALVLVRLQAVPVGTIVVDALAGTVDASSCTEAAWAFLGMSLRSHLASDGLPADRSASLPTRADMSQCQRDVPATNPPLISVVVATRERPRSLEVCLDSLSRMDYPDYEIVVVDNAPVTDATASLVDKRAERSLCYVREPRRGLAAAHNCGLERARGTIVAFTDDDVILDRKWLTEISRGFRAAPNVACVTGLIMPAELQTQAQLMLEAHGHFAKGFEQRVVNCGTHRPADPLFPFTTGKLGSGANMAFHAGRLRELGGFDPATGTGTTARGGDDLAAFFSVLVAGYSLVYQPTALAWHHHRRDLEALSKQVYGYGVGLGAYLTSALADHPAMVGQALRLAPAGLRYAFHPASPRNARVGSSWPRELVWRERRGLALGPLAYGVSRLRSRGARRPDNTRRPAMTRAQTGFAQEAQEVSPR
ncbi:MAG TPA: glycosyltransferase family 2 protein [Trebonia sp.]